MSFLWAHTRGAIVLQEKDANGAWMGMGFPVHRVPSFGVPPIWNCYKIQAQCQIAIVASSAPGGRRED